MLLFATGADAVPIVAPYVELPPCDAHNITLMDELGNPPVVPFGGPGPFPFDEAIASESLIQNQFGCIANPEISGPDFLVHIRNLTATSWTDLFFVADTGNYFNNHDGTILGGLAMRIDAVGVNTPLISESITVNGIFEPGEDWLFLVLDWTGPAPPSIFDSIGVGAGSGGFPPSTASIVANPIPLPSALVLLVSAFGLLRRRETTGQTHSG
ncbi:MAG: hypothetical protein Q8N51_19400 [Gammaproteobacteria bacterium]|nr:hypothetical protein [Gammaproteobacteria bacterium]